MQDGHVLLSASGSNVHLLDADRLFVGAQFQSSSDTALVTGLALCGRNVFAAGAADWGHLAVRCLLGHASSSTAPLPPACCNAMQATLWAARTCGTCGSGAAAVRCFQHSELKEGEQLRLCFSEARSSLVLAGGGSFCVEDLRMPGVRSARFILISPYACGTGQQCRSWCHVLAAVWLKGGLGHTDIPHLHLPCFTADRQDAIPGAPLSLPLGELQ